MGSQKSDSGGESFYDSDIDDFGTIATGNVDLDTLDDESPSVLTDSYPPESAPSPPNSPNSSGDDDKIIPPNLPPINDAIPSSTDEDPKPPSGKSIAHWDIEARNIVYCSFDLESGGEYCGIIQISSQLWHPNTADVMGQDIIVEGDIQLLCLSAGWSDLE